MIAARLSSSLPNRALWLGLVALLHATLLALLVHGRGQNAGASAESRFIYLQLIPEHIESRISSASPAVVHPPSPQHRNQPKKPRAATPTTASSEPAVNSAADDASPTSNRNLDIDEMKRFARGSLSMEEKTSRPPAKPRLTQTEKLGEKIAKATKADCEHKYQGWGLLGIPLLIKDSVVEDGCRW